MNETLVNDDSENGTNNSVKKIISKETGSHFTKIVNELNPKKLLDQENYISALPFIFFLSALAMLYISNSYYAERTIRQIDKAGMELKEMRSEYISTKSELMLMSKQSQVAKSVESTGLKESVVPPKKIVTKN